MCHLNLQNRKLNGVALCFGIIVLSTLAIMVHLGFINAWTAGTRLHNPLKGKLIVIDPGHGGIDGGTTAPGLLEKDINLTVANKVQQELRNLGATVVLTRKRDQDLSNLNNASWSRQCRDLMGRISVIEKHQADLFLSVHVNSNPYKPHTNGPMVFYNQRIPKADSLAAHIQSQLNRLAENYNLKVHQPQPADYYIIRNTNTLGLLVEVGFASNQLDRTLLTSKEYQDRLSKAIAVGLTGYFSSTKAGNPVQVPKEVPPAKKTGNTMVKAYFPHKNNDRLGWEYLHTRLVSKAPGEARLIHEALQAIIEGPHNKNLLPAFSKNVSIRHLTIKEGIAYIDLAGPVRQTLKNDNSEYLAIRALSETAGQFPGIRGIKLSVNGKDTFTLAAHMDTSHVVIPEAPKAVIALVIDDLAGRQTGLAEIMSIPRPLTVAVMPRHQHSNDVAEKAYQRGYQVFLHVPMEPDHGDPAWLGDGAITTRMNSTDVRKTFLGDLRDVPHATGINNHMGSKVTRNEKIMREVLTLAKQKHLIVLDSRTTDQTVIPKLARQLKVPYTERNVFLDNVNSQAYIEKQIQLLANIALQRGSAIGIGHVGATGKNTARAIKNMIPWLESQGIELVYAAQLAK